MAIFAIADLHFGSAVEKPMEVFGEEWRNHTERVVENWSRVVGDEDLVLIAGDISWGMREEEAYPDLDIIDALPGRKVLLEGNHDYWWKSASKLGRRYPRMKFLKNDSVALGRGGYFDLGLDLGGSFICGSRGWLCPTNTKFTAADEKIYLRELIRMRLSLDHAMRQGAEEIILMMHFPPVDEREAMSGFLDVINDSGYPIRTVVYGHLHGAKAHATVLDGERGGIDYHLIAADYIEFCPKKIRD